VPNLTTTELEAGLDHVRAAPRDAGTLALIVARPSRGEREVLPSATLDLEQGLVGDSWLARGSRSTPDRSADPLMQLNVMNVRAADLVAGTRDRVPLAGNQLYLDLDLSVANVPAGARLTIGEAVIEVTPEPHTGCAKFTQRFGLDAMRFVNSPLGKELRLRGLCARVVVPGTITVGDEVHVTRP
jgi:MOSC domain-containing protein YiiM